MRKSMAQGYTVEYDVTETDTTPMWSEETPDPASADFQYETVTYEGDAGEGKAVLGRIVNAIRDYEDEYSGRPERVILGVEDYLAADGFLRHGGGPSLPEYLPCEVSTVPGRMIHVPKANGVAVREHLTEDADE